MKTSSKDKAPTPAHEAPDLVLKADTRIASKYVTAITKADNAVANAERDFCKGFAHNHEGHLPKALKAGFKALRDSGVFSALSDQVIRNLSSRAQWIAAQPYSVQDAIFEADNFKKAYEAARWPKTEPVENTEGDDGESVTPAPREPASHAPVIPQNFDGACNEIAIELNAVIEHIAQVFNQYADHASANVLMVLAADINSAVEKAAKARLATPSKIKAVA